MLNIPLEQTFWKKVVTGDGCWEWKGAKNDVGYGQIMHKRKIHPVSDKDVVQIRSMYGAGDYTQYQLGEMFGTNQSNISLIVNHKTRKGLNCAHL